MRQLFPLAGDNTKATLATAMPILYALQKNLSFHLKEFLAHRRISLDFFK